MNEKKLMNRAADNIRILAASMVEKANSGHPGGAMGGALLRGLDKRLTDKINIPFHIAEDPLHAVAKGTGVALKNVDRFSFLMR